MRKLGWMQVVSREAWERSTNNGLDHRDKPREWVIRGCQRRDCPALSHSYMSGSSTKYPSPVAARRPAHFYRATYQRHPHVPALD